MPDRSPSTPVEAPAFIDGSIVRLMSDGVEDWTERWNGSEWSRHGHNFTVGEFMKALPASRKLLDEFGIP